MKKYFRKNGLILLCVVVLVAVLVGVGTREKETGEAGALTEAANDLRGPVQGVVGAMADWLQGLYGYIYQYDLLVEENIRLRTLLGYLEKNTTFDTEAAQITAWDTSNWINGFTISKGTDQGIELGDCVINESGLLVGQVYEIGNDWASVRTVIDVNMDVGVLVGDGQIAAMVVGDYALMKDGFAKLSYFTDDVTLFVGDDVVTSGAGGAFPSGISIGTITELRSEAGGQSYYAVVDPHIDLSTLSQIFIIKDFEVIE